MFELIGFYFFAFMIILMLGISVFSSSVLYAMSALAVGLIFISGLFFMLGAEFLGVVQIAVYTGAIMVLYAFSMMFFDANEKIKEKSKFDKFIYSMSVFCGLLLVLIFLTPLATQNATNANETNNIALIGQILFSKYLLAFELVAFLLLVAMICAIVLAHKEMNRKGEA